MADWSTRLRGYSESGKSAPRRSVSSSSDSSRSSDKVIVMTDCDGKVIIALLSPPPLILRLQVLVVMVTTRWTVARAYDDTTVTAMRIKAMFLAPYSLL